MDETKLNGEPMPLHQQETRRQRQQLRFSEEVKEQEQKEEEEYQQQKSPTLLQPPGRANRFLSICAPSSQLSGSIVSRLRQLHRRVTKKDGSSMPEEISDEALDKMVFKIQVIPDRKDDLSMLESSLTKRDRKNQEPLEIPAVITSSLSEERRLEIIEEILKDLSDINVLDETRRIDAVPLRLPRNNQLQKNVAERILDLTGNETIMLNDHLYIKNLCKRLDEKHKEALEANFARLESTEKRRQLFQSISNSN